MVALAWKGTWKLVGGKFFDPQSHFPHYRWWSFPTQGEINHKKKKKKESTFDVPLHLRIQKGNGVRFSK